MIKLNNIKFSYPNSNFNLEIDLKIKDGSFNVILGKNGSGKSTLLNIIGGFLMPDSGDIIINEKSVLHLTPFARQVSMMFQDHNTFDHLSVLDNIKLSNKFLRFTNNKTNDNFIDQILKKLDIKTLFNKKVSDLSMGQIQRVAFAMRLVQKHKILLLDEPFTSLDSKNKEIIINMLSYFHKKHHYTIILITHDYTIIKDFIDNVIPLRGGRVKY